MELLWIPGYSGRRGIEREIWRGNLLWAWIGGVYILHTEHIFLTKKKWREYGQKAAGKPRTHRREETQQMGICTAEVKQTKSPNLDGSADGYAEVTTTNTRQGGPIAPTLDSVWYRKKLLGTTDTRRRV